MNINFEIGKLVKRLREVPARARDKALEHGGTNKLHQIGILESEIVYTAAKLESMLKEAKKQ